MTIAFHLILCFERDWAKICCHRCANDDAVYGTEIVGFNGFVLRAGDEDGANGIIPELIVPLRRLPKVISLGGVPTGELRGKEARCGCKLSSP